MRLGAVRSTLMRVLGVNALISHLTKEQRIFGGPWYGEMSASGQRVSVESAMRLSTFAACVRLKSQIVSTLPLKLYRRTDKGREPAPEHPMYRVLCKSPNAEMTPSRFMLMVNASLDLRGNSYTEKLRIGPRVVGLQPLLPQFVTPKRLDSGRISYEYQEPGHAKRTISSRDMMHIRGFGIDGESGLDPVALGRDVLGAAAAADESAAKVFAQGLSASGFLSAEQKLTPTQREELRASLAKFSGSTNAGKLMVLEAGVKYAGVTMEPERAQLLESRSYGVEEICRMMGVPPFMIGHMDKQSSWASSVEGMNLVFLVNTLRAILVNIEQEISRCLLDNSDEYYAEFSVEGLLRADTAARAALYSIALQNGWMSRNEVRRLENLPPIAGGDVYTVQSNLIPIDKLGAVDEAAAARAALQNWLGTLKSDLAEASQSIVGNTPAPHVTVNMPPMNPPDVTVNIEPAVVNVQPPNVQVDGSVIHLEPYIEAKLRGQRTRTKYTRDASGELVEAVTESEDLNEV